MTKARGAADSIGKVGREASFLLPAFSPYYVPYFPLFLRARVHHTHTQSLSRAYIRVDTFTCVYIYTYSRVLFPFCLPLVSVDLLFYTSPPSTPFSFCLSLSLSLPFSLPRHSTAFVASSRRYCTNVRIFLAYAVMCTYMYASSQSSCARGFMSRDSTLPRREGGFVRG